MKIGIDARFLTHPQRGGFKTYVEGLITSLAKVDTENTYLLYLDRTPDPQTKIPEQPNFSYRILSGAFPLVGMPWREQVRLSRQSARDRLDVFHAPCLTAPLFSRIPLVVTIHDTIWYAPPQKTGKSLRSVHQYLLSQYYRFAPRYSASRAEIILTDSQAAKDDIQQTLGLYGKKIIVTYLAAGSMFRSIQNPERITEIRQKFHLPEAFILGVGAADSRKNISSLIHAYALLPSKLRACYPLVIIWAHGYLAEDTTRLTEQLGIKGQVLMREKASLEEMALLYNAADLFVFPSLYEGFGMPPLEAMACGTPVVAANNSSIPEVVGEAALLVDGNDPQDIAAHMEKALSDPLLRRDLIERGLQRAAKFSWETCASQTINAYQLARNAGKPAISPVQKKRVPVNR